MNFPNASSCSQNSLPSLEYYINSDINYGMTPFSNVSYDAMASCCAPNDVNLILGCTLWCELPDSFVEQAENAGRTLLAQFSTCLKNSAEDGDAIIITGTKSGAMSLVRPPRLVDLGLVGLVVSGVVLAMG